MKVKVAAIQIDIIPEQVERNLSRAEELMEAAVESGAEILVLPEMFTTGFDFEHIEELAQDAQGETVSRLRRFSARHKVLVAGGSILERRAEHFYNTMFIVDPQGEIISRYSKSHFFPTGMAEYKYLTRGDSISTFLYRRGSEAVKVGAIICFDLKFEICRNLGLAGTQLLCVAAHWPAQRREQFTLFNRARACENSYYVATANATNIGQRFSSCGYSAIIDPLGNILDEAGNEECFVLSEIDTDFPKMYHMVDCGPLRNAVVDDVTAMSQETIDAMWK